MADDHESKPSTPSQAPAVVDEDEPAELEPPTADSEPQVQASTEDSVTEAESTLESSPQLRVASPGGEQTGDAHGSKPSTPALAAAPEQAEQGSKPGTPVLAVEQTQNDTVTDTASQPTSPTQEQGSKPGSPVVQEQGSKPGTPIEQQQGSKPGTPIEQEQASKPGTPIEQQPGSKPGTPVEQEQGSKPGTPVEQEQGSKPGTPVEQEQGSKPGTPIEQQHGSKPGTPIEQQAGSKPGTPVEQEQGSKPGTPVEQEQGSKPGTPVEQEQGSKPGTPIEKELRSNAGTPIDMEQGSKDASGEAERADSIAPEAQEPETKPATPHMQESVPNSKSGTPPNKGSESKPATPQAAAGSAPTTPAGDQSASRPGTRATPAAPEVPPPPPLRADTARAQSAAEEKTSNCALNLSWSFGMNKTVPVLNLTDELRQSIMYVCANAGIIYDFQNNKQTVLQGHSNDIKCSCASSDKRWVATADIGQDNMIIIWDSYTGIPVRTIFEPYSDNGILAIAMTPDAKYLGTLSAADKQTLAIWDWTVEGEAPICSIELDPNFGLQHYILFHPEDSYQLVTNSDSQVIFYTWHGGKLEFSAPPLSDDDFNKPVGRYSQSIFQVNSNRALTATSLGNLVVWDTLRTSAGSSGKERKALKLVRLQDRGINVLTTTDRCIVSGDVLGHVKFFDQTLKLMNWYQDLQLGPINALSFSHWPEFGTESVYGKEYPPDATIAARKFAIRDFVIGTTTAVYANINTDGTNIQLIHRDHDSAVHGLAAHPNTSRIVIGSYSGFLKVWDYETKEAIVSRWFEKGLMIRCCAFDPKGDFIAIGFTNGSVRVVDALTLSDILSEPFRCSRDAVTHVAFSHDCTYLATADAEYTVSVFKAQGQGEPWIYLGRNRAHYRLIQDLMFGIQLDSDAPRLLSLGEDRVLVEYEFDGNMPTKPQTEEVEYDLENSTKDSLRVASSDRIEQSAIPQCMAWYPPVTAEFFIVTANDQFKFKLYNTTTKMCRKTLLGPTYGSPINKNKKFGRIVILPTANQAQDKRYLAYVTQDKIGIHKLALDGNPHNAMALISHPQGVANLVSSFDGKHVFTAGGLDCTVHMWDVNIPALESQSSLGGEELVPFYGLLEGGQDGELYRELEDYFYYAQVRSQGVDTTDTRRVSTHIPLTEIPFVMRAMGFYPSEQEVEDMLNEVKYSRYVETGQYTTEVDLGEFIKLYINHRPAFGLQHDKIEWAFKVLGFDTQDGVAIDRGDLLDLLQSKGEHMTEYELAEYLTTLLGYNEEGGSSELAKFDPTTTGDIIEESLPQDITADMFSNELLGFSMYSSDILQVDHTESGLAQQVA